MVLKLLNKNTRILFSEIYHDKEIYDMITQLKNHDSDTYEHSKRVGLLSTDIGISLGLNESEQTILVRAGLLHDIGKLKIPKYILRKTTQFKEPDRELMKSHSRFGYEILYLNHETLAKIIISHHEYNKNNSYPRKTSRNHSTELDRLSQIIALADSADALSNVRVYKPYMRKQDVLELMINEYKGDNNLIECIEKRVLF